VSTEGSTIVQHEQLYSLDAVLRRMRSDGVELEQRFVLNCSTQEELPSKSELRAILKQKHEMLMKLTKAKQIHSFSGPVLLYPDPAAVFFHETLGHRLEGSRLLSPAEGKTFRGLVGSRLMNIDLTV